MGRRDRLIARILARPLEAHFRDVRALLEEFGWRLARRRGSHVTFTKPGELAIVVSTHNDRVTRTYLTLICNRLGLREDNE